MKKLVYVASLVVFLALVVLPGVIADSVGEDFELAATGPLNFYNGWSCTGPYDVAIVDNNSIAGAPAEFQSKSLRISNAITSGSFGDQTFTESLIDEAGENGEPTSFSGGVTQPHFEAQFSIASMSTSLQSGLKISVSPDRGDGARMSYLRFEDQSDGIHIYFDEVVGHDSTKPSGEVANFIESDVATISRSVAHIIKFSMDFIDGGPHNDRVKIFVDGAVVKTGTSWEEYYRFDPESNAAYALIDGEYPYSRTVDSLLLRAGGTAVAANEGGGFLLDNFSLSSGPLNSGVAADCRNGGWKDFSDPLFRNQGQCVSYFESHPQ